MSRRRTRRKKNNKKIYIFLGVILLLLAAGGYAGFQIFYKKPVTVIANSDDLVKKMSDAELKKYMQEKADDSYYHLRINTDMYFVKGEKLGQVAIVNSPTNNYTINVKTYLVNGNTLIYESGRIEPGEYVGSGQLKKSLAVGEYKTTSEVIFYKTAKAKEAIGQTAVSGTLKVTEKTEQTTTTTTTNTSTTETTTTSSTETMSEEANQ
ncbi:MAG: hypothetical protein ACK5NA_09745 [Enterococcus sp.]